MNAITNNYVDQNLSPGLSYVSFEFTCLLCGPSFVLLFCFRVFRLGMVDGDLNPGYKTNKGNYNKPLKQLLDYRDAFHLLITTFFTY